MRVIASRFAPIVFLALSTACVSESAPGAAGGGNTDSPGPIVPIGDCSRAEPGCECGTPGRVESCYMPPIDTGAGLECHVGSMECTDGFWSGCQSALSFFRPGMSASALISPPEACSACNPTCQEASDAPTDADLTPDNSSGVDYDPTAGGVTVTPTGIIPGAGADSDGDGVPDSADECVGPGWYAPCDGSTSNDGYYHTLPFNGPAETDPLDLTIQIRTADVYFLMDTTGSMGGELSTLQTDLTTGTFLPGCNGGIIGAIRCTIPDAWFGVGRFDDYPVDPYGLGSSGDIVFEHLQSVDGDETLSQTAVSGLGLHNGNDGPESNSQALWAIATGGSLSTFLPAQTSCTGTNWGYPCFREGTVPIVVMFTDAPFHNGPTATYDYGSLDPDPAPPATSTATSGNEAQASAYNIGDVTSSWVSFTGNLCGMTNDVNACRSWTDGGDAVFQFTLTSTQTVVINLEGTGTTYPTVTLTDSAFAFMNCGAWPAAPPRISQTLAAGTYYVIVDNWTSGCGDFQLNIGVPPGGGTGFTGESWPDVVTALTDNNVKVITVQSCNGASWCADGEPDATALANATDSIDSLGTPLVLPINSDGTGLSTSVVDAIVDLADYSRLDVSARGVDNPATPTIDERDFIDAIAAVSFPAGRCTGILGGSVFQQCLPGTDVNFQVTFRNDVVMQTTVPQVFEFWVEVLGDGAFQLDLVPVRIIIPASGPVYPPSGYYQRDYDAGEVCTIPPQFPTWGDFAFDVSTPSDTSIDFEFSTASTAAGLDTATVTTVSVPSGTSPVDVDATLQAAGLSQVDQFLRVRAVLNTSSDGSETPVLTSYSLQFTCSDNT